MRKSLCAALAFFIFFQAKSFACSAFTLVKDGQVLVAKSYDWFLGFGHGAVFTNKVGLKKYAGSLTDGGNPARWTSRYGSVVLTQFGKGFPISGMNTEGLVVEMLQLRRTRYERESAGRPFINESQWSQYQLDNFKSVDEVVAHIGDLHVDGLYTGIHYFIADQSGKTAIVEFVNRQAHVYVGEKLPITALSNSIYPDLLQFAEKTGYQPVAQPQILGTSKQRFTLAASGVVAACTTDDLQTLAWKTLADVKMAGLAGFFEPSQWNIVHDPKNLTIQFKTRANPEIRRIDFSQLDFSPQAVELMMNMNTESQWSPYSAEANRRLIEQNAPLVGRAKRNRLAAQVESPCASSLLNGAMLPLVPPST